MHLCQPLLLLLVLLMCLLELRLLLCLLLKLQVQPKILFIVWSACGLLHTPQGWQHALLPLLSWGGGHLLVCLCVCVWLQGVGVHRPWEGQAVLALQAGELLPGLYRAEAATDRQRACKGSICTSVGTSSVVWHMRWIIRAASQGHTVCCSEA